MLYLKKYSTYSILFSFILVVSGTATYAAENKDAPMLVSGTTKVIAEDVLDLIGTKSNLIIVDARIRSDRKHGYIEGSISLPDVETTCSSLKKIIPEKASPVVFYCNGVKCGRSVISSKIALKCGYNNIYWFRGGYEEWSTKKLPFVK